MSLEERYSKKSNSIFLFGGAFDPIHNGHIQIAKEIFQKFMPLEFFLFQVIIRLIRILLHPTKIESKC